MTSRGCDGNRDGLGMDDSGYLMRDERRMSGMWWRRPGRSNGRGEKEVGHGAASTAAAEAMAVQVIEMAGARKWKLLSTGGTAFASFLDPALTATRLCL